MFGLPSSSLMRPYSTISRELRYSTRPPISSATRLSVCGLPAGDSRASGDDGPGGVDGVAGDDGGGALTAPAAGVGTEASKARRHPAAMPAAPQSPRRSRPGRFRRPATVRQARTRTRVQMRAPAAAPRARPASAGSRAACGYRRADRPRRTRRRQRASGSSWCAIRPGNGRMIAHE